MDRVRQLVREAHRRSLWQVLSVYLVASWVALQVVEIITESAGLPDWAQPFALMLLIIGLPVVLATAVVQEGVSSARREGQQDGAEIPEAVGEAASEAKAESLEEDSAGVRHRLFTWRNAIAGGVAAFALLGFLVAGYFAMWSAGIGPVGSLAAQGVFNEGDAVVLAQFENNSDDESLGDMVTEALRVDLGGSSVLTLVEPSRVRDALQRMGRATDEVLDAELAREVAIRDGFKAVIHGTVGSAGSGYLFVASMQAAESGQVLATFRESAKGPDEVIDAIDKLSQDIRQKAGESLRAIKSEEPLERVSTSSLEALRKYAEADRLAEKAEYPRAIAVLREAIDEDPSFAMAYRRLAVLLQNSGGSLAEQVEATAKAYELRDRLTERERYLATAYYHNLVTLDLDAEIQAYETVLERFPDDRTSLNNIALALTAKTRLPEAIAALERAVNGPGASASAFTNLPGYLAQAGLHSEAEEALARLQNRYPGRALWMAWNRFLLSAFRGDAQATQAAGAALLALPEAQGGWRAAGHLGLSVGSAMAGKLQEAKLHAADGLREMEAMGDWSQVLFVGLSPVYLELVVGRKEEAERALAQFALEETLASIPAAVRDYRSVVWMFAHLGKAEEVEEVLEEWAAAGVPSSSSPVFDEARKGAEAVLTGLADPARGLGGLNDLARELNCPECFLWTRVHFAETATQWDEARDLLLASLRGGSDDFIGEPLQRILAHEKLGRVYEALGDSVAASEHYGLFAEYWADADPELQPRVEAAREKAAALSAGAEPEAADSAPSGEGQDS